MGKDKRGFGERSTNEAPIAPKLHKRLDRCRAVWSEYIKGERRGWMCVLPKASDRLGSDRSRPHFKLERIGSCCECSCWFSVSIYTKSFVKFFVEHHRAASVDLMVETSYFVRSRSSSVPSTCQGCAPESYKLVATFLSP